MENFRSFFSYRLRSYVCEKWAKIIYNTQRLNHRYITVEFKRFIVYCYSKYHFDLNVRLVDALGIFAQYFVCLFACLFKFIAI